MKNVCSVETERCVCVLVGAFFPRSQSGGGGGGGCRYNNESTH